MKDGLIPQSFAHRVEDWEGRRPRKGENYFFSLLETTVELRAVDGSL
jgi:hypothetical protein